MRDMSIDELQRKVLAAARALPSSDHVPYAFERRIMAQLVAVGPIDAWALWSRLLWRAAAPCVGIMLILGVYTVVENRTIGPADGLAADLDRTVWGPLSSLEDSW
jgi:hypothetical protein